MNGATSNLQVVITAQDDASAVINALNSSVGSLGSGMDMLSTLAGLAADAIAALGTAAVAAETAVVTAAADQQVATANLNTSIQDNIDVANQAAQGQGAFSDELKFSKTQMDLAQNTLNKMTAANNVATGATQAQKDKLASLNATLDEQQAKLSQLTSTSAKGATTAAEHAASIDKLRASIQSTTDSISTLSGKMNDNGTASKYSADEIEAQKEKVDTLSSKYQVLAGRMDLVGMSASQVEAMFAPAIQAGINLGFTFDDTSSSLNTLENVIGNPTEALKALAAAQDLSRAKGISLSEASTLVAQATQGMGRGLQTVGVFLKDGVGGLEAIDAIQQQTKGHAEAYSKTLTGQLAVAWANVNEVMASVGKIQIPWLTGMVSNFSKLVEIIGEFVSSTPKATKDLNDFLLRMGIGQETIDIFKSEWLVIASAWTNTVQPALMQLWNALQPYLPYLIQVASVMGTMLVVAIESFVVGISKAITVVIPFAQSISDNLVGAFKTMITWIKEAIDWVDQLISKLSNSMVGKALGAVGSAIGSAASALGYRAAGGPVSGGSPYIVGEQGPELFVPGMSGSIVPNGSMGGGGGSSITVNINGGMITEDVARQIGNIMIAQFKRTSRW